MQKNYIDKLAYIYVKNDKVLMSLSRGKDTWYIPGGKREEDESDLDALVREVKEELNVSLIIKSIKYYGTFEAQAHGKSEGVVVRMTCFMADFTGELAATSEIESIDFFTYAQRSLAAPVDHLIFDDLHKRGMLV
ncbi:MAG: protein containing domain [Candidatus Saccharibacteria bacterium]|nr:protein containing domain [Candidatus Saccharibacteria bacterium]